MKIVSGTTEFHITEDTVMTIGKFDGFHLGHACITDEMLSFRRRGLKTAVLTFSTPPAVVAMREDMKLLTTPVEKELIFEKIGIDYLVEFPFNEITAAISADEFIEEYVVKRMRAKAVVVGEDCRFGHRASGNVDVLNEYGRRLGFETRVIKKLVDEHSNKVISSTLLRELLSEGNIDEVNRLAGHPYYIEGEFSRLCDERDAVTSDISDEPGLFGCSGIYSVSVPSNKLLPPAGSYYIKHGAFDRDNVCEMLCKLDGCNGSMSHEFNNTYSLLEI